MLKYNSCSVVAVQSQC